MYTGLQVKCIIFVRYEPNLDLLDKLQQKSETSQEKLIGGSRCWMRTDIMKLSIFSRLSGERA